MSVSDSVLSPVVSQLLILPNDLLWFIGQWLDTLDLLSLRRTNRRFGHMASRCSTTACIEEASPALVHYISAQRRRLTRVELELTFPPLQAEVDAFIALTTLEHLVNLEILLEDRYSLEELRDIMTGTNFDALMRALPLLRFPRLVTLRIRGMVWFQTKDAAQALIMALLEHTHSLEHLEFHFPCDRSQLYTWTPGVARTLANLRSLEVSNDFLQDIQATANVPIQLQHLTYLCLGSKHDNRHKTRTPYAMSVQDIAVDLSTLTISMFKKDTFRALPRSLQWLRLVVWEPSLYIAFVSMLSDAPWLCLTSLLVEEANKTRPNFTNLIAHEQATQQRFSAMIHTIATQCPVLAMLYVSSWNFTAHFLVLLTEFACRAPLLRTLHLDICNKIPFLLDGAIDTMRSALPSHVQLIVSYADQWDEKGQVLEDEMRASNKCARSWHNFIRESHEHRLTLR
jgi:hypothetical protein